jgi:hypothetical protein
MAGQSAGRTLDLGSTPQNRELRSISSQIFPAAGLQVDVGSLRSRVGPDGAGQREIATGGVSRQTIDILPARSSGLASRCDLTYAPSTYDPVPIIDQDSVERRVGVYVGCAIESRAPIEHNQN